MMNSVFTALELLDCWHSEFDSMIKVITLLSLRLTFLQLQNCWVLTTAPKSLIKSPFEAAFVVTKLR